MHVFTGIVSVCVRDAWLHVHSKLLIQFLVTLYLNFLVEQVQQIMPTHKMSKEQKKRKGKTQIYKGPRKSKKTG